MIILGIFLIEATAAGTFRKKMATYFFSVSAIILPKLLFTCLLIYFILYHVYFFADPVLIDWLHSVAAERDG